MSKYQVIARKYRPQKFSEVIAQDAIIETLRHAVVGGRIAHAYLFSGSRGTGKTTTARIFAKALNCPKRSKQGEPCGKCSSCREIAEGISLDVIEIDGASHRGIEDVRRINETAGCAAAGGMYKIFIIDEAHMLTKEASNALLKLLEEPPEKVLFMFATTEQHKILPTIQSRCQRFQLKRIPHPLIVEKLQAIVKDMSIKAEEEALALVANRAEGGLRDAESLLDQVIAFHEGDLTAEAAAAVLGIVARDVYFALDEAAKLGDMSQAFSLTHQLFTEGKDLTHFVEGLIEHFRNLLIVKVSGPDAPFLQITEKERARYAEVSKWYSEEQCHELLNTLTQSQQQMRTAPSLRIALETILLEVIRIHYKIPVVALVKRLVELEKKVDTSPQVQTTSAPPPEKKVEAPASQQVSSTPPPEKMAVARLSEKSASPKQFEEKRSHYDTLVQFAGVELEGKVEKK